MNETALRATHERLLAGDPTASLDLVEHAGPALTRWLAGKYRVDETWIADAVTDTLFDLIHRPTTYQPDRGSLFGYLRMSAERDLKNRINSERKHQQVLSLEAVAEFAEEGNTPLAERLADPTVDPDRWVQEVDPVLIDTILRELPDEQDRQVFLLMARGVRSTQAFARVLRITHLSQEEQRRRVKQTKDRIRIRLKRALRRRGWRYGN
ncbi:MAG: hypothetical protein RMM58_11810 [Chloroflexota bacterium]|nr:hypothetical protein [Dehalococcoidia bacterium]MDW8254551.1 hypothetical protein [Chloroflexota bacterium]